MAWKAQLLEPVFAGGDRIVAAFGFYDDAVGTTPVHSETFSFSPAWTNADMQAAVIARGKQIRDANLRAVVIAAAFPPVTTVIPIP